MQRYAIYKFSAPNRWPSTSTSPMRDPSTAGQWNRGECGRLDILVNNAGSTSEAVEEISMHEWKQVMTPT